MFDIGDLASIGSMVPHHYYNSPLDSCSDSWGHIRVIQFREDFAGSRMMELAEMRKIKLMLKKSAYGLTFPRETAQAARPLISGLSEARGSRRIIMLLELLELLADADYRQLSTVSSEELQIRPDDHRLNGVLRYINEHLAAGQGVTLDKAAAKACMNPQAFSRYFRKTTGRRFIDYVNEIRVGKACHLLLNTDKTISEICYEAGFCNLSNFNRHFLKVKQVSPKQFRQRYMAMAMPGRS